MEIYNLMALINAMVVKLVETGSEKDDILLRRVVYLPDYVAVEFGSISGPGSQWALGYSDLPLIVLANEHDVDEIESAIDAGEVL